jgi:hypothetical protein
VPGVEATHNIAERAHRFGVLWRKRSQGTGSEKGHHWVERSCYCVTPVASAVVRRFRGWLQRCHACATVSLLTSAGLPTKNPCWRRLPGNQILLQQQCLERRISMRRHHSTKSQLEKSSATPSRPSSIGGSQSQKRTRNLGSFIPHCHCDEVPIQIS